MKKLVSLFLVFSLVALSGNLYAKKKGAEIILYKKGEEMPDNRWKGTTWEKKPSKPSGIKGELIAVKENSILLLNSEGADVSIDIGEVKVIKIVKKYKAGTGALIGLLVGAAIGTAIQADEVASGSWFPAYSGAILGLPGALIGAGVGATSRSYKTVQIEGKSDSEIKEALEKLRKKARIPDYK